MKLLRCCTKVPRGAAYRLAAATLTTAAMIASVDAQQASGAEQESVSRARTAAEDASGGDIEARSSAKNEQRSGIAVVEIVRSATDDSISASVSNALLAEVVAVLEESLGVDVSLHASSLADEPVANVRFADQTLEFAIARLFDGFSHASYVQSESGRRIVSIYSVTEQRVQAQPVVSADSAPAYSAVEPHANLESLRPLTEFEQAVEEFKAGVDHPPGVEPDEYEEEIRMEEEAHAMAALRDARTQRALDALGRETSTRTKADAISELADADDARATQALAGAVQDTSLAPPARQHALETLLNRGDEFGYDNVPIIELLETLAQDKSFAVSSTAQRSLPRLRKELAK